VTRPHDVGGMEGFGPVGDDDAPFHEDWEARLLALHTVLLRKGVYSIDELRDATERIPATTYVDSSYFERRFLAVRALLREKGLLDA
jgi:nitrile hydratase subunit beta